MQRERKDKQDHIQPPLYLEYDPEEHAKETMEFYENHFSSLFEEEYEVEAHEEEGDDLNAPLDDGDIDNYCRQFIDFMQIQLYRKYDLRYYRKISRMQDKIEDPYP